MLSCNPSKYVPEEKYLLYSSKVRINDKSISQDALKSYIRQKPNKKIFGFIRFHLGLYNLSDIKKQTGINKFLRNIGEEPVIYDPNLTDKTLVQLKKYMENKGYYNSGISDSVQFRGKNAYVVYNIDAGKPYTIRNIRYAISDTIIRNLYFSDTINSTVKPGGLFDKDVAFQNERTHIEKLLRVNGYYNFTKEYVFFEADTFLSTKQVDLLVQIKNPEIVSTGQEVKHKVYKVRKLVVTSVPNLLDNSDSVITSDTIDAGKGIYLTDIRKLRLNPKSFVQFIYIQPGKIYNENSVDETYTHVSSLNLFKLVDIKFSEVNLPDTSEFVWLDCSLRLSPSSLQSYSTDLEGTNSSGNIGGAVNLKYQHINLFSNAEVFDLKLKGAIESLKETKTSSISRSEEFGVEANIKFQTFLIPARTRNFIKKYNPKTLLSLSYNYQNRPDYARRVANLGFGYTWRQSRYQEHIFRPFEVNFVDIKKTSPYIDSLILVSAYYASSYRDHMIVDLSYSYIYNNQNIRKNRNFSYFRLNLESAGNGLSLFNNKLEEAGDSSFRYHKLLGIQYSQYLRGDIEYKYYNIINPFSRTVYRFFAGLAYPYGNAHAIPFEKQYYSGGSNGLRGWQLRSLGPGSYSDTSTVNAKRYPNSSADLKLEVNFEYRFKLFWVLEGGFFMDAGNIWAIRKDDTRPGALFQWNRFYKEIALDSGLGFRFDFSFFLVRLDFGLKMRDPSQAAGNRWILGTRKLTSDDYAFNIGIGYPF